MIDIDKHAGIILLVIFILTCIFTAVCEYFNDKIKAYFKIIRYKKSAIYLFEKKQKKTARIANHQQWEAKLVEIENILRKRGRL